MSAQFFRPLFLSLLAVGAASSCKGTTIDNKKAEKAIGSFFKDKFPGKPIEVTCPKDIKLKKGGVFECIATVGKAPLTVTVTQSDDEGTVAWEVTDGIPAMQIKEGTEKLVRTLIEKSLGVKDAKVECPEKIEIKEGGTFQCKSVIDGIEVLSEIEQQDDKANVSYRLTKGVVLTGPLIYQLQAEFKAKSVVAEVTCEKGVYLSKPNTGFTCTAQDTKGDKAKVLVTIQDEIGNLKWKIEVEKSK